MIEKTHGDSDKIPSYKPHTPKPKEFKDSGEGGVHRFGKMVFTHKQWKQFINNLVKSILSDMKKQDKRIKKAQENLKRSIEGQPPIS